MPTSAEIYKHLLNGEALYYTENYVFIRPSAPSVILLPNAGGLLVNAQGVVFGDPDDPQFVRKTVSWNWLEPDVVRAANLLSDEVSLQTTPCSGTISIQNIRNEFYAGGGPSNIGELGANILGVAWGTALGLNSFYCKSAIQPINADICRLSVHIVTSSVGIYQPSTGACSVSAGDGGYLNSGSALVTFNPASYNSFSSQMIFEAGSFSNYYLSQELTKSYSATVNGYCEHTQGGDGDLQYRIHTVANP